MCLKSQRTLVRAGLRTVEGGVQFRCLSLPPDVSHSVCVCVCVYGVCV